MGQFKEKQILINLIMCEKRTRSDVVCLWKLHLMKHGKLQHVMYLHYILALPYPYWTWTWIVIVSYTLWTGPIFFFLSDLCYVFYISRQWLKSEDIQRISLFFHNKSLEKEVRDCTSRLASFVPERIYQNSYLQSYLFLPLHLEYPEIL